jgi:hypothetical protein
VHVPHTSGTGAISGMLRIIGQLNADPYSATDAAAIANLSSSRAARSIVL